MTTLPNMSLVLPTRGAPGSGLWADALDAALALLDAHDHTSGKGARVPTAGINVNADLTFGGLYAPTNLHRLSFASVAALAANNKSLFVSSADNELYWRSNAGTNVKMTLNGALNVAAFTGGIGGDYAAAGASLAFDDSNKRYTFKDGAAAWARLAAGDLRLFETGTTESLFVGLAAPAALAGSYTITMPLAVPGSTSLVSMDSSGVLTAVNPVAQAVTFTSLITANTGVTAGANQHVTVSGTGEYKHGDRILNIHGGSVAPSANVLVDSSGNATSTGSAIMQFPIPLHKGDRIKSVTLARAGDGAVDLTIDVMKMTSSGTVASINVSGSIVVTNPSASYADTVVDVTDTTVGAGDTFCLNVSANAANANVCSIRVTYDRP